MVNPKNNKTGERGRSGVRVGWGGAVISVILWYHGCLVLLKHGFGTDVSLIERVV